MLLENVVEKHVLVFADGQNSAMLLLEPTGKLFQRRWQTPRTETPSGVVFVAGRELLERERPLVLAMADKLAPCHLFSRLSSNAISCAHPSVVRWEEMELRAQHVSLSFFFGFVFARLAGDVGESSPKMWRVRCRNRAAPNFVFPFNCTTGKDARSDNAALRFDTLPNCSSSFRAMFSDMLGMHIKMRVST